VLFSSRSDEIVCIKRIAALRAELRGVRGILGLPAALIAAVNRRSGGSGLSAVLAELTLVNSTAGACPALCLSGLGLAAVRAELSGVGGSALACPCTLGGSRLGCGLLYILLNRLLCLLLSAAALLSLAACTSPLEEKLWEILTPTLVQGDLDALYLGEFNENYLDLTGASEEDCQSAYEQNLSLSADIFARCFGITNLTDDLRSEVEDLYREIYARAHYSVVGAVQIDETHYTVTVNVEPMDFFTPVLDGFDDAMVGFRARWIDYVDVSRMTDEQYAAFELDWAQSVLAWCRRNLDGITYLPVQTVEISVTQDGDGLWSTDADSMQAFDEAVLYYPAYEGVLTAA